MHRYEETSRLEKELTKLQTISTIDVEIVIARLALIAERIEDQAIGAQFVLGDAIVAFVVFVALSVVFKCSVLGGTHKLA